LWVSLLDWILGARGPRCDGLPGIPAWELPGPGPVYPSDVSDPCPTGRGLWLRRRAGVRVASRAMSVGSERHSEALGIWRAAISGGVEGLLEVVRRGVSSVGGLWAASSALRWLRAGGVPPAAVEPWVEGWAGYAGGRPDILLGVYPVELADTEAGSPYWERKRVALAAYALMIEASLGSMVGLGYLVSLRDGSVERVCIDDELRGRAVREAERLAPALEADPGLPAGGPGECPATCPFREICWGAPRVDSERGEARVGAEA